MKDAKKRKISCGVLDRRPSRVHFFHLYPAGQPDQRVIENEFGVDVFARSRSGRSLKIQEVPDNKNWVLETIKANIVKDNCRFDSDLWENLCLHTAVPFRCLMVWFDESFSNVIYAAERRAVTCRTMLLVKAHGHQRFRSFSSPVRHWEHESTRSASADLCVHPSGYLR
jgi:hypothetical protein